MYVQLVVLPFQLRSTLHVIAHEKNSYPQLQHLHLREGLPLCLVYEYCKCEAQWKLQSPKLRSYIPVNCWYFGDKYEYTLVLCTAS
jgi:hypothetical protein